MIPNPVNIKVRSMRDTSGRWILAAHLPQSVDRAAKNAEKALKDCLTHAASCWMKGDRPRRWEGRPGIVGFGLVWHMPEDFKPNISMASVECPDAGSDLYPAITYRVDWKNGKVY